MKNSHLAALNFASKVALAMGATTAIGCDRTSSSEAAAPGGGVQTVSVVPQQPPQPPATVIPAAPTLPAPTPAAPAAPPAKIAAASCETILDSAFSDQRDFSQPAPKLSSEANQCCQKMFKSTAKNRGTKHFWNCCDSTDHQAIGCTPWGPPVPASIAWTHRPNRKSGNVLDLRSRAKTAIDLSNLPIPQDPTTRSAAIETWRGRMINEYTSATVFENLAAQIASVAEWKDDADMIAEVCAFADEERRHGALCGAVVEALGGEAIADEAQTFTPDAFPLHADAASPIEAVLRNVLSICCLSETVAVALIGAERLEMPEGALRDLLTTIWADEIGHARFGWRLVAKMSASLDEGAKARLGDYLADVAFDHLIEHELNHLPANSKTLPNGEAYGLCNGNEARELFFATVNDVIAPRLEALGLAA